MSSLFDKIVSVFRSDRSSKDARASARRECASPTPNDAEERAPERPDRDPATVPNDDAPSELDAYDYTLPERLIAQTPLSDRARARMMVVHRDTQTIEHRRVSDIIEYIRPEDALVLNDTKVVPARLIGRRVLTQGRWEGLFLQSDEHGFWEILSKTRGKLRPGEKVELPQFERGNDPAEEHVDHGRDIEGLQQCSSAARAP